MQWALAQLEVEAQLLREALSEPEVDLAEVRKRFDIFFSRIVIFRTSSLYAGLRERPEFESQRAEVDRFIKDTLPLMDGPDAALRAALPRLHVAATELRDEVRNMSLAGLMFFSTNPTASAPR